ncbi:MAG: AMP-binding protein, partial [Gemmatimonadetes bacterium]|nr:AMP-binding protein [Gemmatimonadota bacterium]
MSSDSGSLDALLTEDRRFPPLDSFRARAVINDPGIYAHASADREAYWADWAGHLDWFETWEQVLEWTPPYAKWFTGGKLNVSYNCLDRHLEAGHSDRTALIWEGEPGDELTYTYAELHEEVCRFANALKRLGVKKGARVTVYLPMIPEAAVARLACTRIGA